MLKTYEKLEDVPEALREHYKLIEGRYVPEIGDDHPVKVNNVKLLNEKTAAETKAAGLETANSGLKADLESAKSHSLPRGHRAVPVADIEAMEKLKEHGTASEIVAKLTEHKTLSGKVAQTERTDNLRKAAAVLGYNEAAFLLLENLPNMEVREKDGKKSVVALVKDGDKVVEKVATEYVEATYAPLLPALRAKTETQVPSTGVTTSPTADPFKWAQDYAKQYTEQSTPVADPFKAFQERQSA
jgi:hypothetical protein